MYLLGISALGGSQNTLPCTTSSEIGEGTLLRGLFDELLADNEGNAANISKNVRKR
jgi:hypothetical protein